MTLNYNLDGNQEEPKCRRCSNWKPGPDERDGTQHGHDWRGLMCCWDGRYRCSFWTGARVTHPYKDEHPLHRPDLAPDWCPRRLKNYQCTCGKCPECKILHVNICKKCGVMHLGIRKECNE